ncbi:CrcB family protein [Leucobacter sp. gxy201]|uniref:fluoride efflux transporter FluC n=1 Tax=Leucobacter sp. gxy201 TaxID=2957200 RepID=UPI003DA152E1
MSDRERIREKLPDVALVALGGAVGTLMRYLLDGAIERGVGGVAAGVPVGIFTINVVGAFALALLVEGLAPRGEDRWRATRLLVGTGMLGGFTTYSSLAAGAALLVRSSGEITAGIVGLAAAYGLATVVIGALASWAGIIAGARLRKRRSNAPAFGDTEAGDE